MKVKEIMTKLVTVLPPDALLSEVASVMRDQDIGSIPIADNEHLVGMVTDRDIVVRAVADGADTRKLAARDVMSTGVRYCLEEQSVDEVLDKMGGEQVRRLPVLDAKHRLVGVVSLGDASQALEAKAGDTLKEISQSPPH
jgi:CBS domain-containing protein